MLQTNRNSRRISPLFPILYSTQSYDHSLQGSILIFKFESNFNHGFASKSFGYERNFAMKVELFQKEFPKKIEDKDYYLSRFLLLLLFT